MTSIGESLRRERLRRNLQLDQISSELKISARMLAAIEAEDFDKLPGGVFTKSFVRQYAHVLGLDEEEMAAEVGRMLNPEEPIESGAKPEPAPVPLPRMDAWQSVGDRYSGSSGWWSSLPSLMLVVVVMLLCSAIYAFWQRPRHVVTNAPVQQAQRVAPAPAPASTAADLPAAAPAPQQSPASEASQMPVSDSAAAPSGASNQAATPAKTAPSENAPGPPGPVHVEVTATEAVWLRAASDGKYVFSGTLEPNQTRTVDGNANVELRLGNAGGVNILLNGKPIGAVGPKGQIRNVQLNSGGFQVLAAPKSAAPALDTF